MPEVVEVLRRASCPGVELIQTWETPRAWSHFNDAFSFGTMRDWIGRVDYRRRRHDLASGQVTLFDPGELFYAAPRDGRPGAFRIFEIRPKRFEALCRAEGLTGAIHFASFVTSATPALAAALDGLHAAMLRDAEPLEQQSHLAAVTHASTESVLERTRTTKLRSSALGPNERLRELLHSSEGYRVNLCDFAREAEVSQYQLLRQFKRRYGAPPHAYGLHVRIDRARKMLGSGFSAAQAAAANDFTDQSHFSRHFRRIWGVTPGQYAAGIRQLT